MNIKRPVPRTKPQHRTSEVVGESKKKKIESPEDKDGRERLYLYLHVDLASCLARISVLIWVGDWLDLLFLCSISRLFHVMEGWRSVCDLGYCVGRTPGLVVVVDTSGWDALGGAERGGMLYQKTRKKVRNWISSSFWAEQYGLLDIWIRYYLLTVWYTTGILRRKFGSWARAPDTGARKRTV